MHSVITAATKSLLCNLWKSYRSQIKPLLKLVRSSRRHKVRPCFTEKHSEIDIPIGKREHSTVTEAYEIGGTIRVIFTRDLHKLNRKK